MDKTSLAIRQYEKFSKETVFSIRQLDEDHPNLFLINYSCVVRLSDTKPCELFFQRQQTEYFFYKQAVDKRLPLPCPNILFYIPRGALKAESYLGDSFLPDQVSKEDALKVIDAIALLHQHKLNGHEFDPFDHFYHYKKLTDNPLPTSFEDELIRKMRVLRGSSELVLSHNDLKRRHILFYEGRAFFIDFRNTGENLPLFDLASFFLDVDLGPDTIRACLERYQRIAGGQSYLYQDVFDAMSFIAAYDYYHYSALARESGRAFYKEQAKLRKARCLRLFEETIS